MTASETNDGTRLNEARIKTLTGSDPITARFLHSEFFTFEPVAKFWLAVNHLPIVKDDSYGFWRRVRLIEFRRTFPVNDKLRAELWREAAGILAWIVEGCLAWQRDGLNPPASVLTATREYETESDPLADFLDDACEADPGAHVGGADLYAHYLRWAGQQHLNERERLNQTAFGRRMKRRFQKQRTAAGVVYLGIARRPLHAAGDTNGGDG